MAELLDRRGSVESGYKALTGQQHYFLEVMGPANGVPLSVVSFEAVEKIGEPYRITIELTHPEVLARGDYLGRDAVFTIDPVDFTEPRKFSGCITRFSQVKTTKDFTAYRIVVEAHIARLKLTRASRIYQNRTAPEIIEAVLRRHDLRGHQFLFKLRRKYPAHKFRFQYQIDDWSYIQILMQQEGIYSYILPGEFGDVVVFGDDIDHYIYLPILTVPYREASGLESPKAAIYGATRAESVSALQTHMETVPASFLVADYNPERAYERYKAEANVARQDTTTYGQPYVYGTHHLDRPGAEWEAQLRHEAAIAWQIVYEGESNVFDLRPARVLRMDAALPDAPNGQMIVEITHSGARDKGYRNCYKAIPSDRRFRLRIEDERWPKINGTLSGRVTSPDKDKYAYLTEQGQYRVRFDLDFDEWTKGMESVPLRLAKPFAGGWRTGFHFPVVDGTEAVLEFRDGDPNKPYISQFHHDSEQPDLIAAEKGWYTRNVIRTQSNNKLRFEDAQGYEGIKLSTEHSGKSQLSLGYLVDSQTKQRGEGFELRTSRWGAIRGGKGVFISADDQLAADGQQLDMGAAQQLLERALQQAQTLSEAAGAAQAHAADVAKQRALLENTLNGLKKAGLLASAPEGMALVSGGHMQFSATENLIATAIGDADISTLKKFTVAAGEAVSLFAQKLGMKLFAAKGKVEIEAQSDAIGLQADKNVEITSVAGRIVVSAKDEIILMAGGSYLKLNALGIEDGTPGDRRFKCGKFGATGPVSMSLSKAWDVNQPACRQCMKEMAAAHDPVGERS